MYILQIFSYKVVTKCSASLTQCRSRKDFGSAYLKEHDWTDISGEMWKLILKEQIEPRKEQITKVLSKRARVTKKKWILLARFSLLHFKWCHKKSDKAYRNDEVNRSKICGIYVLVCVCVCLCKQVNSKVSENDFTFGEESKHFVAVEVNYYRCLNADVSAFWIKRKK